MGNDTIWSPDTFEGDMNFEQNEQSDADKKLVAIFFKGTIKNETKSVNEGRPIFDGVDLIRIIAPGTRDTFVGDATPDYQMRFPHQWARYKANQSQDVGGTPLTQVPWLTPEQIAEFHAMHVKTVEHLAGMPDAVAQKFMGFHQIRERAQRYLDAAKEAAPGLKLQAELQKRDELIAQMQETIAALSAKVDAAPAGKAKAVATAG